MNFPPPSKAQARLIWFGAVALAVGLMGAFLFGSILGLGWLLHKLSPVLLPLAIAGILAYLLDPVVDWLQKKKVPRTRAIIVVFFVGVMVVLGMLSTVVPRLVVELGALIKETPTYTRKIIEKVETTATFRRLEPVWHLYTAAEERNATNAPIAGSSPKAATNRTAATANTNQVEEASTNVVNAIMGPPAKGRPDSKLIREVAQVVVQKAGAVLPDVGQWMFARLKQAAGVVGWILGFALVPIYAFYFLLEKKGIQRSWTDYLPLPDGRPKEELIFVLSSVNESLIVFFRGQVLVAMCSGILLTTGFFAMGLNYALLLGFMAGVLGIIPYLGVAMSLVPATILAIVQFGDWRVALVPVLFAVVNALEGFVISPKIIGDRVGLHPLTIIIAVVVGTTLLGGILGGVLAIPLTAALRAIMSRYIWHRQVRASSPETPGADPDPSSRKA
jgi:predicted PurR-regulated permease PerM